MKQAKYVEFDYDLVNDHTVIVHGETDGHNITFKLFDSKTNKKYSKAKLDQLDVNNIEEFILENADEFYRLDDIDYYGEDDCYD